MEKSCDNQGGPCYNNDELENYTESTLRDTRTAGNSSEMTYA